MAQYHALINRGQLQTPKESDRPASEYRLADCVSEVMAACALQHEKASRFKEDLDAVLHWLNGMEGKACRAQPGE